MLDLSIVIPTCDRPALLAAALQSIRQTVRCATEVIVVDGSTGDGTQQILVTAKNAFGDNLTMIREPRREGFVRAANKGFRQARGRYVTWLNDDARPLPLAYDRAVARLAASPADLAFLALFHRWQSPWNVAFETVVDGESFKLCHVRGTLYANFAIGLRSTFERLGYFDERFFLNGADPDLSLKAWQAGLRVEPAWGSCIDHDQHADDRRAADTSAGDVDNKRLFDKWDLPSRDERVSFDSTRPCTLRGMRKAMAAA